MTMVYPGMSKKSWKLFIWSVTGGGILRIDELIQRLEALRTHDVVRGSGHLLPPCKPRGKVSTRALEE